MTAMPSPSSSAPSSVTCASTAPLLTTMSSIEGFDDVDHCPTNCPVGNATSTHATALACTSTPIPGTGSIFAPSSNCCCHASRPVLPSSAITTPPSLTNTTTGPTSNNISSSG